MEYLPVIFQYFTLPWLIFCTPIIGVIVALAVFRFLAADKN